MQVGAMSSAVLDVVQHGVRLSRATARAGLCSAGLRVLYLILPTYVDEVLLACCLPAAAAGPGAVRRPWLLLSQLAEESLC